MLMAPARASTNAADRRKRMPRFYTERRARQNAPAYNFAMKRLCVLALIVAAVSVGRAQTDPTWRQPFDPVRVAGRIYYVGTRGLSSFLVVTPAGAIIIDSGEAESVPFIRANVEK